MNPKHDTQPAHRPTTSRWWRRMRRAHRWFDRHPALRITRKIVVGTVGVILVVGGVVTAPFPGPNFIPVVLGLALLASEFVWARIAIRKGQVAAHRTSERLSGHRLKRLWRWKKRLRQRYGSHHVEPASE